MIPALPLLASLASLIPAAARLFGGEDAAKAAAPIADIARSLTGADDQAGIVAALQASPEALARLTAAVQEVELGLERERTKKLEVINATMQAEARSSDPYVRRWRPHFGYVASYAWAAQTGAIVLAIIGSTVAALFGHAAAATVIMTGLADLMAALTAMWGILLTVLGVSVWQRSKDKAAEAGSPLPTLLEALPFPIPGRKPR